MDLFIIRIVFITVVAVACYHLQPFGLAKFSPWFAACAGVAIGVLVVWFEVRLRVVSLKRLIGAVIGSILGILGAYLFSVVIKNSIIHAETQRFLQLMVMLLMSYVGLIIDGRIADIADTGFLDGVLVIPQFVLHELQMVADSSDSMKRNRGRRGLDVLQRIQKMTHLNIQIVEDDFPHVREVDMKLIELAKVYDCKIVTNDFNLNKVAQLQGVEVLNINELANALKPIVLPGETMRVFILKEGKEYNQGVAYLDDGTMVVVDNARKLIGKNVDVAVTSVLQTTAGKMIFGKFDERVRPMERLDPKLESARPDLRKPQPVVVEAAPHTQPD